MRLAVCLLASWGVTSACAEEPAALGKWVGREAPQTLPILGPALAGRRPVVLHFTGDAGPDNVAQIIALNRLRERYGNRIAFLRAEDETTEGDLLFDAFGASRIPSILVLDGAGLVVAAYEGEVSGEVLAQAIEQALQHGGPPPPTAAAGVYDLASPLASPLDLRGRVAPASPGGLAEVVTAGRPSLVAFMGAFSRFHDEQQAALQAVQDELGAALRVVKVYAEDGASERAFADYAVTGVPTVFLIDESGVVRGVFNGVAPEAVLLPAARGLVLSDGASLASSVGGDGGDGSPDAAAHRSPPNLMSPLYGTRVAASSQVSDELGAANLVDGLIAGDEGFRPWVSASGDAPPYDITATFVRLQTVTALEFLPATGGPALFGQRWPKEVQVLFRGPGSTELVLCREVTLDPSGAPHVVELEPTDMHVLVIRIMSTQGGGPTCEMAEIRATGTPAPAP